MQTVQRPRITIDLGNALVKYMANGVEESFPHALAILNEAQFKKGIAGTIGKKSAHNFIQIEDNFYTVGESAEVFSVERRAGRLKYNAEYYGPFLMSIIAREFSQHPEQMADGVDVLASHAPLDSGYSNSLIKALRGVWNFMSGGKRVKVNVNTVETFDEPLGGYFNAALICDRTRNGEVWRFPLEGYMVGVIDIGGGTISMTKVAPDGSVLIADNGTMGINNTLAAFEQELITAYPSEFQNSRRIPRANMQEALITGVFKARGGATELNVKAQVEQSSIPLLNELATLYMTVLGDGFDLDTVVLTGGGSGCFETHIRKMIKHGDIRLSENTKHIQFSNIRGADKLKVVLGML